MLRDLTDVEQAVRAREDLNERAELSQPYNLAEIRLADLRSRRDVADDLQCLCQSTFIARCHVHFAGIFHVDLHARAFHDAADHLAARSDQVAYLVDRNLYRVDARRELGHVLASRGDDFFHLVEDEQSSAARLFHRFTHDLAGKAADLDVHL